MTHPHRPSRQPLECHPLPDGRTLAWASFGTTDGLPVIYCHGAPASRLDGLIFDAAAVAAGIRLIAIDRPGQGESSPWRDHSLSDWPRDVEHLANTIGLDQFGVMGWSGGGPFALACAHVLGERVPAVTYIAGAAYGALDPETTLKEMSLADRVGGMLALHFKPGLQAMYWGMEMFAEYRPKAFLAALQKNACPTSQEILKDERVAAIFTDTVHECFRQGVAGLVLEAERTYASWPFDVREITTPVRIVQGDDDRFVPPAINQAVAKVMPGATLDMRSGEGHFVAVSAAEELLRDLTTQLSMSGKA